MSFIYAAILFLNFKREPHLLPDILLQKSEDSAIFLYLRSFTIRGVEIVTLNCMLLNFRPFGFFIIDFFRDMDILASGLHLKK
jgi:hypothetical protein